MSPVYSVCSDCGKPFLPSELKRGRCAEQGCMNEKSLEPAGRSTEPRASEGTAVVHRELRKAYERQVQTGLVKCARCGEPIAPGSDWDLGHDDNDRRRYSGPEHRYCNRSTAGKRLDRMLFSRRWPNSFFGREASEDRALDHPTSTIRPGLSNRAARLRPATTRFAGLKRRLVIEL
jgi:hypothetical protein